MWKIQKVRLMCAVKVYLVKHLWACAHAQWFWWRLLLLLIAKKKGVYSLKYLLHAKIVSGSFFHVCAL